MPSSILLRYGIIALFIFIHLLNGFYKMLNAKEVT